MHRAAGLIGALTLLALAAPRAGAQEFVPPDRSGRPAPANAPPQSAAAGTGIHVGLFGFSTRGGFQVNKRGQGVVGSTLDLVELGTPLVRLRPSIEMGFANSNHSLGVNVEIVYRFQSDQAPAIPYLGLGLGYYDDSTSSRVRPTGVMGFELSLSRNMNWLIEYHVIDGFGRSRFLVGLSTRGSN
jgi:hypothetical protein